MRGVCSMARANDPNSADSQFFICFDDARFLDGKYTVWGEVTSGMEDMDKLKRGEPVRQAGQDRFAEGCGRHLMRRPAHRILWCDGHLARKG